jgi:hypothetical protein
MSKNLFKNPGVCWCKDRDLRDGGGWDDYPLLMYPLSETPGIRGQDPEGKYAFYGLFSHYHYTFQYRKTP